MKCRSCVMLSARLVVVFAVFAMSALAARAADEWIQAFNGKDLTGWKVRGDAAGSKWVVGTAKLKEGKPSELSAAPGGQEMINQIRSHDIYTDAKFGDCLVEVEVMMAKGSNSGIYLMGNYEIQLFDSFGKKNVGAADMGGIPRR